MRPLCIGFAITNYKEKKQIRRFLCRESKKWISVLHYLDYISLYSLCYFYKILCMLYMLYVFCMFVHFISRLYIRFSVFGLFRNFLAEFGMFCTAKVAGGKCCDTLRDFGNTLGIFSCDTKMSDQVNWIVANCWM